jgi:prepilin-type N-terminal cleavage/methylation domain-containing protein
MKSYSVKRKMMNQAIRESRGYSIIELLVVLIIIGILIAVIVPVLSSRSREAKQRAAMSDLEHIQDAQERAAVDTGFFYRLYVLDDDWAGDGYGFGDPSDIRDGLMDEAANRIYQNPRNIFIDFQTGEFLINADTFYDNNIRAANETAFNWHGRYVSWQRDTNRDDIGDDPWGNDYLFFTKAGLVYEPNGEIRQTYTGGDGTSHDTTVFDRPTVLSLGPDGLPGSGAGTNFGTGDDLKRQF